MSRHYVGFKDYMGETVRGERIRIIRYFDYAKRLSTCQKYAREYIGSIDIDFYDELDCYDAIREAIENLKNHEYGISGYGKSANSEVRIVKHDDYFTVIIWIYIDEKTETETEIETETETETETTETETTGTETETTETETTGTETETETETSETEVTSYRDYSTCHIIDRSCQINKWIYKGVLND